MNDILDHIDKASEAGLYYVSLFSVLAVPDICGALEVTDGCATKTLYEGWFDKWVAPGYRSGPVGQQQSLSGADCYHFRCRLLHQGSALTPKAPMANRFFFIEPGNSRIRMHNNRMNGAFNIDVGIFCKDMTNAARRWLIAVAGDATYQENAANSIRRHPNGLSPFVQGVPVIG